MRGRLPIDSGTDGGGSPLVGRPADAATDGEAWAALVASVVDLPDGEQRPGVPAEKNDRVTVADHPDGQGLAAFCWARRIPAGPGTPGTAEVIEIGLSPSLDPATAEAAERAVLAAMGDLLVTGGIKTLSMCVDERHPGLATRLEKMGFVARRLRHLYVPAAG